MKRIATLIVLICAFLFTACDTDNKKYYAGDYVFPVISAPAAGTAFVLTEAAANDSLRLVWSEADFGFPAAVTYTVELAEANTFFESPAKLAETKDMKIAVDYATLNNSALIAGLLPETPTRVELRVSAYINNSIRQLRSEPVEVILTAYDVAIHYPVLYVPGSYQGWNPANPGTIVTSLKADGVYEGYFYFPAATEFKFTGQPDWDPLNWGDGGGGKLQAGAGNIKVPNAGFYQVIANISRLTYTVSPVQWSISGAATSNANIQLTYDETSNSLQVTTNLVAGGFMFKESGGNNRTLGLYFGNQLRDNGSPVRIEQSGRYTVILDLSKYPYTYSLE